MIDIGANLTNKSFDKDRNEVITRAKLAGVRAIVVTGTDLNSSHEAIKLAESQPNYLFATAGIHPHDADHFTRDCEALLQSMLQHESVLAAGEMGLDFNRNFSTPANQIEAFERQLALANTLSKPLFLHERDAFAAFYQIIKSQWKQQAHAVVHCFTGNKQALKEYLDLGLYIGITGWIAEPKRGKNLREIIQYAPLDRLLIETDAPYLIPDKKRIAPELAIKHRNEPWTLPTTAQTLADSLKIPVNQIVEATTENSQTFFNCQFNA